MSVFFTLLVHWYSLVTDQQPSFRISIPGELAKTFSGLWGYWKLLSKGFERHSCFYRTRVKIKAAYHPGLKKKKTIINTIDDFLLSEWFRCATPFFNDSKLDYLKNLSPVLFSLLIHGVIHFRCHPYKPSSPPNLFLSFAEGCFWK